MTPTVATWLHAARDALANAVRCAHRDGDAWSALAATGALQLVSDVLASNGDPEPRSDGCPDDAPQCLAGGETDA